MKLSEVKIQPKLHINSPGDKYEQEADAMAEKVMRMPANGTDFKPKTGIIGTSVQRKCAACEEEEKQRKIMRKETGGLGGSAVSNAFSSTLNATKGAGTSLPQSTGGFMENAFSTDFSNVRIHTDSQANQLSRDINAKAFTHGNDIYFGAGQYSPNTYSGKSLLAHELMHTVQQNLNHDPQQSIQRITDEALEFRHTPAPPPNPTSPVEVTAIDDVDYVGWMESFLSLGEVNFTDINTFVSNVLGNITTHPMSRLNVQVHGSSSSLIIGNTRINMGNIASYRGVLSLLNGHFTSSGFVHLRACYVGNALSLVTELARIFGVPVYAATGQQRNLIIPFNMGNYVRCDPAGTCNTNASRP